MVYPQFETHPIYRAYLDLFLGHFSESGTPAISGLSLDSSGEHLPVFFHGMGAKSTSLGNCW